MRPASSSDASKDRATRARRCALAFLVPVIGLALGAPESAGAEEVSHWLLSPDFAARAREVAVGQRLDVEDVPLADPRAAAPATGRVDDSADGPTGTLRLRRIEVFRPGAPIVVNRATRRETFRAPDTAHFAGTVAGRDGSFAFLSVDAQETRGLVSDGAGLWQVGSTDGTPEVHWIDPNGPDGGGAAPWGCESEEAIEPLGGSPIAAARAAAAILTAAAAEAPAIYVADVAVETDAEFHDLFETTDEAIAYVGDLFAAMSAIYERDVGATLRVSHLSLWSEGPESDPWTATSTMAGLNEFMDAWRASHGDVERTVAHFLSGKRTGGGVAYVGVLCSSYYGYGFTGSINGRFSVSDPWLFWDVMGVSHELGHNFGSGHTHCYSPPIDQCYNGQSGCYTGTTSVPSNGGGTIMSYCHLRSGGYSNINLWFGREGLYGDDSLRVPDLMRSRVESAWCMEAVAPVPTVSIDAAPTTIAVGDPTTISWTSTDAEGCLFVGGASGSVETTGSLEVRPEAHETYRIECTGPGGTADASVEVTVIRPQTALTIDGDVLRIVGPSDDGVKMTIRHRTTADGELIEIKERKTEVVLPPGGPCTAAGSIVRCMGVFSSIEVFLGDARDRVVVRGPIPAHLDGGGENDVLRGGDGGDTLVGGPGRDRLIGRGGNDFLRGDGGADRLDGGPGDDSLQGGLGPDRLIGRGGIDTAVYVGRSQPVSVTFDDSANDGEPDEQDNVRSNVELVAD